MLVEVYRYSVKTCISPHVGVHNRDLDERSASRLHIVVRFHREAGSLGAKQQPVARSVLELRAWAQMWGGVGFAVCRCLEVWAPGSVGGLEMCVWGEINAWSW